jgi:hypothetical protein
MGGAILPEWKGANRDFARAGNTAWSARSKPIVTRTTITAAELYTILDAEFRKSRPKACRRCRMPMPYWRAPPDDVSANWHIGTPVECPHGCHLAVAELLARMWTLYDVHRERKN